MSRKKTRKPKPAGVTTVIHDIERIYETGQHDAKTDGNKLTLYTNWRIGERIHKEEQHASDRADYGTRLLDTLSDRLNRKYGKGFSRRNLAYMRLFHRSYKLAEVHYELTWGHYQRLLGVADERKRRDLERQALAEHLTERQLRDLTRRRPPRAPKRPEGRLDTHATVRKTDLRGRRHVHFDLGFGVYVDDLFDNYPQARRHPVFHIPANGKNVEPGKPGDLYLYRATPERVVDADTIVLQVHLGFGIIKRDRFRLRSVNMPELSETAGKRLSTWIRKRLHDCDPLVVRTHGNDRYARYLADILYLPGERDAEKVLKNGRHLNAELLRLGYEA
jgi:endonuclease YncB( thermonuclease family)